MTAPVRRGFVVSGRVQGVAFRAFTRDAAATHGVTGFVANHADGTVRGECQGEPGSVAAFLEAVRGGSPWSRVDAVELLELTAAPDEIGFTVRR